jgi:hypothetical protein
LQDLPSTLPSSTREEVEANCLSTKDYLSKRPLSTREVKKHPSSRENETLLI